MLQLSVYAVCIRLLFRNYSCCNLNTVSYFNRAFGYHVLIIIKQETDDCEHWILEVQWILRVRMQWKEYDVSAGGIKFCEVGYLQLDSMCGT